MNMYKYINRTSRKKERERERGKRETRDKDRRWKRIHCSKKY